LILRKNIKIVATRCQFLRPNAPKSILAGAPPQTPLGSSQRSPDPLAVFKGREGKGKEGGKGKGRGRERGTPASPQCGILATPLTNPPCSAVSLRELS